MLPSPCWPTPRPCLCENSQVSRCAGAAGHLALDGTHRAGSGGAGTGTCCQQRTTVPRSLFGSSTTGPGDWPWWSGGEEGRRWCGQGLGPPLFRAQVFTRGQRGAPARQRPGSCLPGSLQGLSSSFPPHWPCDLATLRCPCLPGTKRTSGLPRCPHQDALCAPAHCPWVLSPPHHWLASLATCPLRDAGTDASFLHPESLPAAPFALTSR